MKSGFWVALAVIGSSIGLAAEPPVRVLIVDGFGNHDWRRTTMLVREVLERRSDFVISVSTAPADTAEPNYPSWNPDIAQCDVVIQTCNDINRSGPLWNETARKSFEAFVSGGGGVFVLHSGNNAFPKWEAYNHMIGLGWRDKSFGKAIRVKPDETLEIIPAGEGNSTGHGERTDRLIHRLGNHPIHQGMPRVWMTPKIEVYTWARGPAENIEILSWAEDPATKERWPIEWTVAYGKGRIYTSTFGHVWKDEENPVDFRCAGFQTLILRTVQWLAKRQVDEPVPADFPTETETSLRDLKPR